ncbi:hypothetical protein [Roseibium sp. RKSG952]|uniref:hypothetical protein n=1 Tax=Roseibium sp. RKSG952 TaxID=2529384 RepID=UPI0012BC531B|nr:hypothetical protein [Roseibium sp. RKSG952]MTH94711.1 hypothetical protein [Roseibium sp. RKSG952]
MKALPDNIHQKGPDMDVIEVRGGVNKGQALRFKNKGFIGGYINHRAFEVGIEVFKHVDDSNGFAIYLGPFCILVGWFKK